MRRFDRQDPPAFWAGYVVRWLGLLSRPEAEAPSAKDKLQQWQVASQKLAKWFHDTVRPAGEPSLCAYCDGTLKEQSPETIDHFVPEHRCPQAGLTWANLYPACSSCNSSYKRTRWSWHVVRPDLDPVDKWFDLDPESGALRVAPEFERQAGVRRRVNRTIKLFNLNEPTRCRARRTVIRNVSNALTSHDWAHVDDMRQNGPYRFVLERVLHDLGGAPTGGGAGRASGLGRTPLHSAATGGRAAAGGALAARPPRGGRSEKMQPAPVPGPRPKHPQGRQGFSRSIGMAAGLAGTALGSAGGGGGALTAGGLAAGACLVEAALCTSRCRRSDTISSSSP